MQVEKLTYFIRDTNLSVLL